jgi:hypothetical protein
MKEQMNYGLLFAGFNVSDDEKLRVGNEISKLGGLSFSHIEKTTDGWYTQCDQLDSIMAGNSNPNPTPIEVESEIRKAIFAAFNVSLLGEESKNFKFEYQLEATV